MAEPDEPARLKGQPGDRHRSPLGWLKSRLLPETPDFYSLLVAQCEVTASGTRRLVEFLRDDDPVQGAEVRRLEHEGDRVRERNLDILHRSFATPMDPEDFYDAVMSIDEILNYAKTSVREIEILGLAPDEDMVAMACQIDTGAQALLEGVRALQHEPQTAARCSERARKTEREIEKLYRQALARLFDPGHALASVPPAVVGESGQSQATDPNRVASLLTAVTQMLKRREVYRHLSNAGDHVAHAAQILRDIVTKAT